MGNQSISKTRYFRTSTFQVGSFAHAIEQILTEHDKGNRAFINISRNLPDGSSIFDESVSTSALEQICIFKDLHINIHISESQINVIRILGEDDYVSLEIDAVGAQVIYQVFDQFIKTLGLVEVASPLQTAERLSKSYPPEKTLPGIIKRIEKLESAIFDPGNRLKCFLSYRFGGENDTIAQQVKKFLELLDIEVTTGEAYEPRKVSDKVIAKLQADLDLIILLVTADGESIWTRDEIAIAHERGAHIVPIVQNGTKFTAGIFGDHEWIPYEPGHISDAFIKVLEAVQYVRRKKVKDTISKLG